MKPVIMVSHFFPFPPKAGAQIRTSLVLRMISETSRVVLVSCDDGKGDAAEAGRYAEEVVTIPHKGFGLLRSVARRLGEPFTGMPAAGRWLEIKAFAEAIGSMEKKLGDSVLWLEASWLLDAVAPGRKRTIVLDQHNLDSEVLRKRAMNATFPLSMLYGHDFRKQRRFERRELKKADFVLTVSNEEKELHERIFGVRDVEVLPNLLDLERYPFRPPSGGPPVIVMTGDFSYEPNMAGARYMANEILPIVRRNVPPARMVFAGKGSGDLPFRGEGIELHGAFETPDEIFPRASVAVAPIFTGGGSRYKILEALACGVPVVSTPAGAEGIDIGGPDGVLVREGARDFASGVVSMLTDPGLARRLAEKGRVKVEELYSMERGRSLIKRVLEKAETLKK